MAHFHRLVRFEDAEGRTHYGEASGHPWDAELSGLSVKVYSGSSPWADDFQLTDKSATISKVLCPVASAPVIHGVGLNYRKHAEEAGFPIPPEPVMFVKYADSLAGPYEDIPINPNAQNLDYEGELTVIIGRDCKNLSESQNPLDYVFGYTVGNDVSSRYWQDKERSGAQHGYAKSFDKFAPIGPVISSPLEIPDPTKLKLRTWVNGELRQESGTDDLIHDIPKVIRHLSRGMTLRAGTLIMTGTPSGVAAFMNPPAFLKDGDVVEIGIEPIGKIRNKMVFEKS